MIKRIYINKIVKILVIFLIVLLLYLFPKKEVYNLKSETVMGESKYHDIFLIDKNNMVAKTDIAINSSTLDDLIEELIELLIVDGKYNDKIPSGFNPIIPSETRILNKKVENDIITINFNDKFLDIEEEKENQMIESIIYTLTSIKSIKGINVFVNDKVLEKLPKSDIKMEYPLTRKYGINKEYEIDNLKDIINVTVYYASKFDDKTYYVPVTKYMNSKQNKIEIIIDELTSRISYNSNLISYLNSNAKLLDYSFNEDDLDLNFNEYLFDNKQDKKVLEEVIYSISYSVEDTLYLKKVNFFVNNQEIKK